MSSPQYLKHAMAAFSIGPLDDDGLLQPSTLPWGRGVGSIARPRLASSAIAARGVTRTLFELGGVLARSSLLQLGHVAQAFEGLAGDVAAETGGEGLSWLIDRQPHWTAEQRFDIQLGAMFELHTVFIAMMRGVDVAAVLRAYGLQGCNDDFRAVQTEGKPLRDLWGPGDDQPAVAGAAAGACGAAREAS